MEYFIAEEEEEETNNDYFLPNKKEKKELINITLNKVLALLTGGLTFVAALAWNDAFQNFFNNHPLIKAKGIWIYAIIVTIIAVALIVLFSFINQKIKDDIHL